MLCSNFSQTLLIHCVDLVKCLMLLNASVKVRQLFVVYASVHTHT